MISSTNGRGKTIPINKKGQIKQKAKRPKKNSKLNIPVVLFALVFCYLVISLSGEIQRLNAMQHSVIELEQEINQLQSRNTELHQILRSMENKEYVEQVAREELGLVKPGENLIVPVEEQKQTGFKVRDTNIKD
ncbi:MAG: septum formation initiator family protein [Firmicutes bacterium]|nr:septum formation initiator family protein [Bacillota bacterium]